jgi:hypothetical protein
VEAGAHRPYRRAHRACDLVHREIAIKPKNDRDALLRVEIPESALECLTILDLAMGVMRGSLRSCSIQLVVPADLAASKAVAAGVGEDSSKPSVEPIGVTEPIPIAPGSCECVVRNILGLLWVTEDEMGQPIGGIQALVDELLECSGARRIGVVRDGPNVLRQLGLSFRVHPRPLHVPTRGCPDSFNLPRAGNRVAGLVAVDERESQALMGLGEAGARSDTLAVTSETDAPVMTQPTQPPLVSVQFRLGTATGPAVEVDIRSFGDRWVAVATIAGGLEHGLGRTAREALAGALASLGQSAVTSLLGDLALLAPSVEILRQERALGA